MAQTTGRAFETYVMQMLAAKGWQKGSVSAWDKELGPVSGSGDDVYR